MKSMTRPRLLEEMRRERETERERERNRRENAGATVNEQISNFLAVWR